MKRERVHRERMKMWTQRGSHVGDGIRKPSTSAGMLTWCHKLDIKKIVPQSGPKRKGRATIRCLPLQILGKGVIVCKPPMFGFCPLFTPMF